MVRSGGSVFCESGFFWLLPRCYSRSLRRVGRGLTPGIRFGRGDGSERWLCFLRIGVLLAATALLQPESAPRWSRLDSWDTFRKQPSLGSEHSGYVSEAGTGLRQDGPKTKAALVGSDLWPTKASVCNIPRTETQRRSQAATTAAQAPSHKRGSDWLRAPPALDKWGESWENMWWIDLRDWRRMSCEF